jgi:hypothetical protein
MSLRFFDSFRLTLKSGRYGLDCQPQAAHLVLALQSGVTMH